MECNCNNNNNGGVIPWVRGNRLPLCICIYQMNVDQGTVSTMAYNTMTRTPYAIQADDTVTVVMKSGFRSVEMPFTTDGNKVLVIDNGELPTGTYTVEVTIERGSGERGRWQESRQVRIYENTDEAILGEMYSIEADLFFWAKGETGVGIANITSNPDDTLTITMTDGTTYTTQAMKGDKGDKGDQGEKGTSIVSFDVTGQTETSVIYTVTFSDDTTEEVAVPKGPQGDTGLTGNGISSTTLNSDYTLTIAYTDGTTYTTSSIRGAQGVQGVSIIAFTQTGETATNTLYNVVFSDGRTQSVAIPKGLKGDKGDTGNTGPQGIQGPKGDTVTATDYTLYNVQGSSSEGAMSQDATTKAISAQTGYYTCGAAADKVDKVAAVESGNLYKRTLGGHFKVKMTNANTASGVTLQVGSETATTLWYNGAAASADNSWDAGEVLSVYYDGTYYQASNAMGGGATGKKKLTGVLNTVYDTVGDKIASPRTANNYQGIKYPVQAGDVVLVSGTGGASALLWAIAGTKEGAEGDDNILDRESPSATRVNKVLVMPENAHWVVLNSTTANAEWYYAKKGSVGAHEILTEAYLYEDLRTLEVGQTFRENEAVKTSDKQLFKLTKDINVVSLTDEVIQGDLKVNGNNTYQALVSVSNYSADSTYSDGDYAVGSPSGAMVGITVDSETVSSLTEDVYITVTIAGIETTVTVTSESTAESVASAIQTAFSSDEWSLTVDSEDTTNLVLVSKVAKNDTPTITSETGDSGVTIGFVEDSAYAGSLNVSSFDGDVWTEVTNIDEYIGSGIWEIKTVDDLLQYTVQNTWASYLQVEKSVSSNPYTLPSKQSLILYRGLSVQKRKTYTVHLRSAESLHHSYVTIFLYAGNQEVSNTVRFESTTDIKDGVIAQLTATKDTNANLYMYEGTGTWTGIELECKVSWVDNACSIEEKVKWEEEEGKNRVKNVDDYPYRKVSKVIPYVSTGYIYANWGDKFGTVQTKSTNYHITDYIECAGATKLKYPQQIASNVYIGLVFYDLEHKPILGRCAYCRYRDETNYPVYRVIDVPEDAVYFRNSTWDGGEEYTLYYDPTMLDLTTSLNDMTSEVNTLSETIERWAPKMEFDPQLVKKMTLARYSGTDGVNSLGLVHFSDLHGDSVAVSELRNFISKYSTYFDDVIETGDTVFQEADNTKMKVSPESLFVLGNHDGAADGGGEWEEGNKDWDAMGKEWDYDTYFAPYLNNWGVGEADGVHMPEGYNDPESRYYKSCFWYKDYSFAQIRLIGLDCIHRYDGRSYEGRSYLTREQEDWFADTLEDARTNGYKVIVACHYGLDDFYHAFKKWDDTNHIWKYNFITEESKTNDSGHDGGYVMNSMTNRKSSFHAYDETLVYEKKFCLRVRGTAPKSDKTGENIFGDILSEWIDNGGEFIAWISGHTHRDIMFYPEKYPNILNVVIDRAGTRSSGGTNINRRYDGTNQRLAANLYYVRGNAFIIVRIGCNMTNNLEPLSWTAINYKTGQIISQG